MNQVGLKGFHSLICCFFQQMLETQQKNFELYCEMTPEIVSDWWQNSASFRLAFFGRSICRLLLIYACIHLLRAMDDKWHWNAYISQNVNSLLCFCLPTGMNVFNWNSNSVHVALGKEGQSLALKQSRLLTFFCFSVRTNSSVGNIKMCAAPFRKKKKTKWQFHLSFKRSFCEIPTQELKRVKQLFSMESISATGKRRKAEKAEGSHSTKGHDLFLRSMTQDSFHMHHISAN